MAEIEVSKKAEYVMIEIPIPAGCSYGENGDKRNYAEVHREYFKTKPIYSVKIFLQENTSLK